MRAVQSTGSPREMWAKLNVYYVANTMGNKIGVLSSLLKSRLKKDKDIGGYLVVFETKFNKLAGIKLPVAEEMQVAISLVCLSNEEWLSRIIAALKTMKTKRLTWDAVSSRFIEKQRI